MSYPEQVPIMGELIITAIKASIEKAKAISTVSHPFLKGRLREAFIGEILLPYLPSSYRIASGKIFDCFGNQSDECDILIIDSTRIPPILRTQGNLGLFPIESVLAVIEVKSKLASSDYLLISKKEGKRTGIGPNAKKISKLSLLQGMFISGQYVNPHRTYPLFSIFAYDTDVKDKDELDRVKEKIPDYYTYIHQICVVGKSTHMIYREGRYAKFEFDENLIEVRGFISCLLDNLSKIALSRGYPPVNKYLLNEKELNSESKGTIC